MRRIAASVVALGVVTALGVASCDSGGGSGSGPSAGGSPAGTGPSGACSLADPPVSRDTRPTLASSGTVRGRVGVLLPGRSPGTRSSRVDARLLTRALDREGATPHVEIARGDARTFIAGAHRLIHDGVRVLVVEAVDDAAGVAVERAAARADIPVIDFERLTLGGSAPYYVSFDAEDIGRLQAQTLLDCLSRQGVVDPRLIMVDGGTDVDEGAVLLAKGAHEVLDPVVAAGRATLVAEVAVPGWEVARAPAVFSQALAASNRRVSGVVAADDGIAGAVIGVLKAQGLSGVALTGQDSGIRGLRNIVTGQQSMTIFADAELEADATAQLASALIRQKSPQVAGLTLTAFTDPRSPDRDVQALLLPGQVITQANVHDVVAAGALTTAQICRGLTSACATLGLH